MPYKSVGGANGPDSSWKEIVRSGERQRREQEVDRMLGRLESRLDSQLVKLNQLLENTRKEEGRLTPDSCLQEQIDSLEVDKTNLTDELIEAKQHRDRYMKERDELSEELHDLKVATSDYTGMKEAREHAEERMQYYYAKADVFKKELREEKRVSRALANRVDDLNESCAKWKRRNIELQTSLRAWENMAQGDSAWKRSE